MSDRTPQDRTCQIDYTGDGSMEDFFDDLVEVFFAHGLEVEGGSDGPRAESDAHRLAAGQLDEALRLLRESEEALNTADALLELANLAWDGWNKISAIRAFLATVEGGSS